MEIIDISQLANHYDIINALISLRNVCNISVQFAKNKHLTISKITILLRTSFVQRGVLFSKWDAAKLLTKARVSNYNEFTKRHKLRALHFMFLSWF